MTGFTVAAISVPPERRDPHSMRRNPSILPLRLGEGAAPSISLPSMHLRFAGSREVERVFFRPAQKEAADRLNRPPNVKRLAIDRSFKPVKRHARRALLARSSYFALDCF